MTTADGAPAADPDTLGGRIRATGKDGIEQAARVHAELWASLELSGQMIGARDLWIAATALSDDLAVATSNPREFERVPGLDVLAVDKG